MKKSELKQAVTIYKHNIQVAEKKAVIYEKVYNYLIAKRDEAKLSTTKALYQAIIDLFTED